MSLEQVYKAFVDSFDGTVTVTYEKYERFGGGEIGRKSYKGTDLLKILVRISKKHHYGVDLVEWKEETGKEATPIDLLKEIEGINGDGCDCIFTLETRNGKSKLEFVEIDEDEEEVV